MPYGMYTTIQKFGDNKIKKKKLILLLTDAIN